MRDRSTGEPDRDAAACEAKHEAVATPASAPASGTHGVVIGVLAGVDDRGRPLVAYAGNPQLLPVAARSTGNVDPAAAGREVALLFEGGDIAKPLLIGVVQSERHTGGSDSRPSGTVDAAGTPEESTQTTPDRTEVLVDDERVDIEARERIVLRCGKASITLTRAGKVIIRGAYVSSRSSGANRIKGGSVQIN